MTSSEYSILCIGELVWDLFPDGARIGGAPLNVSVHLARQGVRVQLLTAVGRDELGAMAVQFLAREGIRGVLVHPGLPTGTVNVELDPQGVPRFTIHGHGAWTDLGGAHVSGTQLSWDAFDLSRISVITFGGLAMHSLGNRVLLSGLFREFHRRGMPLPVRICDLNLRPERSDPGVVRWCIDQTDILKVNEEELGVMKNLEPAPVAASAQHLLHRYLLQGLCVTLGSEGLRWLGRSGEEFMLPVWNAEDSPVLDTVGAGDAITASIALGIHLKESPRCFLERGRMWAARVCGVCGALPPRLSQPDVT